MKKKYRCIAAGLGLACLIFSACSNAGSTAGRAGLDLSRAEWLVIGPFDNAKSTGTWGDCSGFFTDNLLPDGGESGIRPVEGRKTGALMWKAVRAKSGRIDFIRVFGQRYNAVAYAYLEIESPEAKKMTLRTGSDDGIEVLLNGSPVLSRHAHRSYADDQEAVVLDLQEGANRLLVKIDQGTGEWEFGARLTEMEEEVKTWASRSSADFVFIPRDSVLPSGGTAAFSLLTQPVAGVEEPVTVRAYGDSGELLAEKMSKTGGMDVLSLPSAYEGIVVFRAEGGGSLEGIVHSGRVCLRGRRRNRGSVRITRKESGFSARGHEEKTSRTASRRTIAE